MNSYLDRREAPRYRAPEAARHLKLPESTVWAWFFGQPNFDPLFVAADIEAKLLSFYNLIEAHALSWTKQQYPKLRAVRIRKALQYVSEEMPQYPRPLINRKFSTDGKHLFLRALDLSEKDEEGPTINASRWGQTALPFMDQVLDLIDYDEKDLARILYPRSGGKVVVINPTISSGRPIVNGSGVLASIIWQRARRAQEPIDRLARDYNLETSEIQAAIDYIEAA